MSLLPASRAETRRKVYKIGIDAVKSRRRREVTLMKIRKSKREDNLFKKRREQELDDLLHIPFTLNTMPFVPAMAQGVWSEDSATQLEATYKIRNLLSFVLNVNASLIDDVIKSGVVPRFVEFLARHDAPRLQFEASWILTNIASGTSNHTRVVVELGAVPLFVQLLSSSTVEIREQAVWALGNIAGDSPQCRDYILSEGALLPLLSQLNPLSSLSIMRNAAWTLSNFCRGKPYVDFEQVKLAFPVLKQLIHSTDEEILTEVCWTLCYLSEDIDGKVQAVLDAGVCPRLVELLQHQSESILLPTIRSLGNIVYGDDAQTQVLIDRGVLPCLRQIMMQNHKKGIMKEVCWTISNITAGTKAQVQAVLEANIILPLVRLLHHAEFEVKKEAAWAICNATYIGSHEHIKFLVIQGCLKPLCDLLTCLDLNAVTLCLEGLENILKVGEADKEMGLHGGTNIYAEMVEEYGGLEKIERLQNHDNNEIYKRAVRILERFWDEEELDETNVENSDDAIQQTFYLGINPPDIPAGGFNFGSQ
ncbi:importin subunit alpha-4-like [Abrus precatorius]|uniref:Importin subunit alpha n=1 Tax=Abrus precatorius TaxID=3816 RepID=A0A8B8L4A2_ABRPR|nr:importin subunit alpha-4-like [Abrus precatorius]